MIQRRILLLLLCGAVLAAPARGQPEATSEVTPAEAPAESGAVTEAPADSGAVSDVPAEGGADADAAAEVPAAEPTLGEVIGARLERFEDLREQIVALVPRVRAAEGEERITLAFRLRDRWLEAIDVAQELVADLAAAEGAGIDVGEVRPRVETALGAVSRGIPALIDQVDERLAALRTARETAEGEAAHEIQDQIGKALANRSILEGQYLDHLDALEALGLDASDARADLEERLRSRAEDLSGRIRARSQELAWARTRAQAEPGDAQRAEAVRLAELRLDQVAGALRSTVAALGDLELDTARYDRVLIESTGEITGAIFDREVATGLLEQWTESILAWARANLSTVLFRVLLFAFLLLVTGLAARLTRHLVEQAVSGPRARLTELARRMLTTLSGRVVWFLGLLIALSQLGVQIGPLLAGLGVAGFIIGFALQDTLGNFASGAMLLIYRPYDVGDLVEVAGGVFGSVSQQSLVSTTILTIDNQTLVIPNSRIWGDVIRNVTAQERRRVDLVFNVSYRDDIQRAQQLFEAILKEHPKVLADPPPMVKVHELGDWCVRFVVRPWVETADYWEVYWDVTREVKLRFDREGLHIPVPRQEVHVRAGDDGARSEDRAGAPRSA